MFRGFNLSISKGFFENKEKSFREYCSIGEKHLDDQKSHYQKTLKKYIKDSEIDGTKIQEEWFPQMEADIFISHSHNDRDVACALAGWLYDTFKIKCFIDSNVWGYSKELIQIMNDDLSIKETGQDGKALYDLNNCNLVSQHVNVMLSIALQKMIDKTEAVILINTANSVTIYNAGKMAETYSPWIYTEIMCSRIVRRKSLKTYRDYPKIQKRGESPVNENAGLKYQISYEISLEHLTELSEEDLNNWEKEREQSYTVNGVFDKYALDALYWNIWPWEVERAMES